MIILYMDSEEFSCDQFVWYPTTECDRLGCYMVETEEDACGLVQAVSNHQRRMIHYIIYNFHLFV